MIHPRKYLVLLAAFLCCTTGFAYSQPPAADSFGHHFLFNMITTDTRNMVREPVYITVSDTAIHRLFDHLKPGNNPNHIGTQPYSPLILGVKLSPHLRHYHSATAQSISKEYYSFLIQDSSAAILIALGINSSNYRNFRYHVVENDSLELVPWSPVPKLEQSYGASQPYGFLGKYQAPGKRIMIEVLNEKDYSEREGVIFDWRTDFKPLLEQIIVSSNGNYFNLAYPSLNRGYASRFNQTNGAPEDFRFPQDSVQAITVKLKKQETMAYSVHLIRRREQITDTLHLDQVDSHGFFILDAGTYQTPGLYEIVFQRQARYPDWDKKQSLRIVFEVLSKRKGIPAKTVLWVAIGTLLCIALMGLLLQRKNKQRFKKIMQQKESAQLKLKSVRSQLNPHFMFNALGSIQNLLNKKANDEANHYLTRFAALTRAALESSEKDMISLEDEWKTTDIYLQMEQLRFGFSYQLKMDPSLHPANIEVPPMILQPFIENSVKHGIRSGRKAMIQVTAKQTDHDLQLIVEDNGPGLDVNKQNNGFGLKLSQERIRLLNDLYAGKPFKLEIMSSSTGTTISITLNKWI